jgi:hypothetical protein
MHITIVVHPQGPGPIVSVQITVSLPPKLNYLLIQVVNLNLGRTGPTTLQSPASADTLVEPSCDSSSANRAAPPIVTNAANIGDSINDDLSATDSVTDSEIRAWTSTVAACQKLKDVMDAADTGDSINDDSSATQSDTESDIRARAWAAASTAQRKNLLFVTPNNKVVSSFQHIYQYICNLSMTLSAASYSRTSIPIHAT